MLFLTGRWRAGHANIARVNAEENKCGDAVHHSLTAGDCRDSTTSAHVRRTRSN